MSSENLGLVAVGVTLFAINAFLGAPIASRIARFFGRVLPADARKVQDDARARTSVSGVTSVADVAGMPNALPSERPSSAAGRAA